MRVAETRKRLREFDLTVAVDAGDAEYLAAAHVECNRADTRPFEAIDPQPRGALRRYASYVRNRGVAPDHHFGESGLGHLTDRRAAGDAAGAQHDDAIADVEHLWQFMRYEDDALPLPAQPPKDRQEIGNLTRREIGSRLVEDQQFGFAQHRLEDFDTLSPPERQVGDHGVGSRLRPKRWLASRTRAAISWRFSRWPASGQPSITFSTTLIASINMKC